MHRLPARTFYGVILAGWLGGVLLAAAGGLLYVRSGDARPAGRRVLDDVAADLVVPLAGMMGGTFGGLAGVAAAVRLDGRRSGDGGRREVR